MNKKQKIKALFESEYTIIKISRDVIPTVIVFALISQIIFGLWAPMVAVESESMLPHIQIGDIIFIQNIDRTQITTYAKGKDTGYTSFDDFGDVILYKPYGKEKVTPIIHRAMYYVEEGETMWDNGPVAPHSGYITKGDNPTTNPWYDQKGALSFQQPVKKEWIIGVARFHRIPVLGYIPLIPRKILSI